jgi:cytochrome P450
MMSEIPLEAFPFRLESEDFGTPTRLYNRSKGCPLTRIRLPSGDTAYFVIDHDDVELVLKDKRFSRNFRYPGAPRMVAEGDLSLSPDAIVNLDPPEHTRLRRTIAGSFRPRHSAAWRPVIERIVGDLLDAMIATGPPADLVGDYASLLPIRVMCELLDIPADDQASLISWTGIFFSTADVSTADRVAAGSAFLTYVIDLVATRRAAPGAGIVDELIAACDVDGALTEAELYQMISALFIGGQENTAAILARGVLTLLREPTRYAALCADPALVEPAVEEILRFEVASEGAFLRVATCDVEVTSGTIEKGSAVQVSIPAANRDARWFADPGTFDLRRPANPHVTFGAGAHFCPGAPLARLELAVALEAITTRLPGLRLAIDPAEVSYAQGTLVRALLRLPVAW